MQFDIKELYPPIVTDGTLNSNFAESYILISQDNIQFINTDKSLLFYHNKPWIKKERNSSFDVTMGIYDFTELCKLIEIYVQSLLKNTR